VQRKTRKDLLVSATTRLRLGGSGRDRPRCPLPGRSKGMPNLYPLRNVGHGGRQIIDRLAPAGNAHAALTARQGPAFSAGDSPLRAGYAGCYCLGSLDSSAFIDIRQPASHCSRHLGLPQPCPWPATKHSGLPPTARTPRPRRDRASPHRTHHQRQKPSVRPR